MIEILYTFCSDPAVLACYTDRWMASQCGRDFRNPLNYYVPRRKSAKQYYYDKFAPDEQGKSYQQLQNEHKQSDFLEDRCIHKPHYSNDLLLEKIIAGQAEIRAKLGNKRKRVPQELNAPR